MTTVRVRDTEAGRAARAEAIRKALRKRRNQEAREIIRATASRLIQSHPYITVDMVRKECDDKLHPEVDRRIYGGALLGHPDLEPGDFVPTTIATCHARPVRRFYRKQVEVG